MNKPFINTAPLLKMIRKNLGLTQAEYAKQLNVHIQVVSNFERGICLPPVPQMKKIYKAMSLSQRESFTIRVYEDRGNQYMKKIKG